MKKIIVTGGAGYIGAHTVLELLVAGYEPIIIDNFSNTKPFMFDRLCTLAGRAITLYQGDCTDADFLDNVFQTEKNITGVIHFAALKAVGESVAEPLRYYRNNLLATLNILSAMEKHQVQDLVFSSSATVYGEPEQCPISETAIRQPATSPYGATKAMAEDIIADVAKTGAIKAVALRYFNPIGAHASGMIGELPLGTPSNLVPYITQATAGIIPPLTIFGTDYATLDGSCVRDFIHVVDLAKAHVATLKYLATAKENYDTFNVGTGQGTSVLELIKTFEEATGETVPKNVGDRRQGDIPVCYANVAKIKTTLGWQAEATVADALKDAWRWQSNLKEIEV